MITQCDIDVRYPDCDAMGIVHHAVYPIWYEIARMDFFEKMGFAYPDMHALGVDPPMVSLELKYRAPVTYPGRVTVRTRMLSCAPKKLELAYETFRAGEDTPCPSISGQGRTAAPTTWPPTNLRCGRKSRRRWRSESGSKRTDHAPGEFRLIRGHV